MRSIWSPVNNSSFSAIEQSERNTPWSQLSIKQGKTSISQTSPRLLLKLFRLNRGETLLWFIFLVPDFEDVVLSLSHIYILLLFIKYGCDLETSLHARKQTLDHFRAKSEWTFWYVCTFRTSAEIKIQWDYGVKYFFSCTIKILLKISL